MYKPEMVEMIAEKAGLTKKAAESALNAVLGAITEALENGDTVQLVGFGSFVVKRRAARTARNPKTDEQIQIPERNAVVFKPGKGLKELVR